MNEDPRLPQDAPAKDDQHSKEGPATGKADDRSKWRDWAIGRLWPDVEQSLPDSVKQ